MSRLALAALMALVAGSADAQRVPGRSLLTFPIGLTGDGAALGEGPAAGFWNPATGFLDEGARARFAIAALSAPVDLALSAQLANVGLRSRWGAVTISVAHAAVNDLVRTDTDPQAIGGDIPYRTMLVSGGLARRLHPHVVGGVALRWNWGHVDTHRGTAVAADAGIVIDRLAPVDGRVAISSFMWTPSRDNAPALLVAGDARVIGPDSLRTVRAGFALSRVHGGVTEYYPFADARYSKLSVRAGPVRTDAYGSTTWLFRLGVALRHEGYIIGLAREDNASGLHASYQLTVANVIR